MAYAPQFTVQRIAFDEHYQPGENTRITTNFANLARGENRQENLRNTLQMIDNRFNALAHWDNAYADRYSVELDIISVELHLHSEQRSSGLPLIELLQTHIVDHTTNRRIDGMVGNNFSSYVRDYDFSVLLLDDERVIHETTPIQPRAADQTAWRDTLVLTYRRGGFQGPEEGLHP